MAKLTNRHVDAKSLFADLGRGGLGDGGLSASAVDYRGTPLIRNSAPLGPYSRTLHRALWWPWGRGLFLMSEVDGGLSDPTVD